MNANDFQSFYGAPPPDVIPSAPSPPRFLPLVERSANEGVANALARLLTTDESLVESGSLTALLILTGIQAFLDSGGDYLAVERIWEPVIVTQQLKRAYGLSALDKVKEMATAARALNDNRGAEIYERVVTILTVDKTIDNQS